MDDNLRTKEREFCETGTDTAHLAYLIEHDRAHGTNRVVTERPDLCVGAFLDAMQRQMETFKQDLISLCEAYTGEYLVLTQKIFQYSMWIVAERTYFVSQGSLRIRVSDTNAGELLSQEPGNLATYVNSLDAAGLVDAATRVREQLSPERMQDP